MILNRFVEVSSEIEQSTQNQELWLCWNKALVDFGHENNISWYLIAKQPDILGKKLQVFSRKDFGSEVQLERGEQRPTAGKRMQALSQISCMDVVTWVHG